jgi:hypothetical protein
MIGLASGQCSQRLQQIFAQCKGFRMRPRKSSAHRKGVAGSGSRRAHARRLEISSPLADQTADARANGRAQTS